MMAVTKKIKPKKADDFASVAKRLECDENLAAFDAKLKKIAPKKKGKNR
jgi:hypothetical protein